jgi:hypothetical protein
MDAWVECHCFSPYRPLVFPRPVLVRVAAILAGFILLAALFIHLGPTRILLLLARLGWNFLVVVALFGTHEVVRTVAIRSCLPADLRPPLGELLLIRVLGEAAGAVTRTGALAAEPARAWLLANRSGQAAAAYAAAVGELLANSFASAGVTAAVSAWVLLRTGMTGPVIVLADVLFWGSSVYLSMIVAHLVSRGAILRAGIRVAGRWPVLGPRLRRDAASVVGTQQSVGVTATRRPAVFWSIVPLELLAQCLLVCEVYWTIRSMGVAVSVRSALFMEVMTRGLTIVEFVGATEMGFAVVFTWLGMPAAIGFSLSLVRTLRSLAAAAIVVVLSRLRAVDGPAAGLRRSLVEPETPVCLDSTLQDVHARIRSSP